MVVEEVDCSSGGVRVASESDLHRHCRDVGAVATAVELGEHHTECESTALKYHYQAYAIYKMIIP